MKDVRWLLSSGKKGVFLLFVAGMMTACASYDGRGLKAGLSTRDDVISLMGEPAMRWSEADGGEKLAFPRGPAGFHTYMVKLDLAGKFVSRDNVLEMKHFSRLREGMSKDDVLRMLGPSFPGWTLYYQARDELVWEWRWCDDYNEPARFNVFFDGTSGKLRSTANIVERQSMPFGSGDRRTWCSR